MKLQAATSLNCNQTVSVPYNILLQYETLILFLFVQENISTISVPLGIIRKTTLTLYQKPNSISTLIHTCLTLIIALKRPIFDNKLKKEYN